MGMTDKQWFIDRVVRSVCLKCRRPERIRARCEKEISDKDFEYESDAKASKIVAEEA